MSLERVNRILQAGQNAAKTPYGASQIGCFTVHCDDENAYAEPGYEGKLVVCGNYNAVSKWSPDDQKSTVVDDTPNRVAKMLEKAGAELEWSDEWTSCTDCGKLVRTSADSYGWSQYYHHFEDTSSIVCGDCLKEDPTEYLEALEGSHRKCVTFDLDLEEHGYRKLDGEYQNGLYGGQTDDPEIIAKALKAKGVERFIFDLDSVGQFDLHFSVWVHEDEDISEDALDSEVTGGSDPAQDLQKALASVDLSRKGTGIQVTTIKGDKAEVREITPREFVEGTWTK